MSVPVSNMSFDIESVKGSWSQYWQIVGITKSDLYCRIEFKKRINQIPTRISSLQIKTKRLDLSRHVFIFDLVSNMSFSSSEVLGSTQEGSTIPDVIINVAEGNGSKRIGGFGQVVHNPIELKTLVEGFAQEEIPSFFADAVMLRRIELQKINDTWDFPLAAAVPNTVPLPSTVIEASEKAAFTNFSVEYNIMRHLDFIGRNILRIELPTIDLYDINAEAVSKSDPTQNMYLGAWYRDLVPRIIKEVAIYPKSSTHQLYTYSGYDIFIHNIIFGNERKEMNDLMSGEDKFELCYDPYRVDGSALGAQSYKGLDVYKNYTFNKDTAQENLYAATQSSGQSYGQDGLVDFYAPSDLMDYEEFTDMYRQDSWFERPVAQNYLSRHSIHSRRVCHYGRSINVPLDILPFSYNIGSALNTASISGETGFIRITVHDDWVSRAFYCTALCDVPPAHRLVNHRHFENGDMFEFTALDGSTRVHGTVGNDDGDMLIGWVNTRSLGRFGDAEFRSQNNGEDTNSNDFNVLNAYATEGAVINDPGASRKDNIVQTGISINTTENIKPNVGVVPGSRAGKFMTHAYGGNTDRYGLVSAPTAANVSNQLYVNGTSNEQVNVNSDRTRYLPSMSALYDTKTGRTYGSKYNRNFYAGARSTSTTAMASDNDIVADILVSKLDEYSPVVKPLIAINSSYDQTVRSNLRLRLFQIGFQTLQCVSELMTKLPNIYITTEWNEMDIQVRDPLNEISFRINNDLYQVANVFWILPTDAYNIENTRVYACNKINHEMPLVNVLEMKTQLNQGNCRYDWDMLNIVNPAYMGLNPLMENIGIISYSPEIHANAYPLAYYDPNINGQLEGKFCLGKNIYHNFVGADRYSINIRRGVVKIISIGINGVVNVNLQLYRLVF